MRWLGTAACLALVDHRPHRGFEIRRGYFPSWTSEAAGFSHTADFVDYMGRVAARSSPSASIVVHPYFPVRVEMNGVADMRKHDDLGQ